MLYLSVTETSDSEQNCSYPQLEFLWLWIPHFTLPRHRAAVLRSSRALKSSFGIRHAMIAKFARLDGVTVTFEIGLCTV